jgi:hypothetical protein
VKKSSLLSLSLLFTLTLASCSSNEINNVNITNQNVESLASNSSKTIKFKRDKVSNLKDPDLNPNPKEFSVTIKKILSKNSQNPNTTQIYNILSSSIESLANMEVSYDDANGNVNYDKAKAMSDFVKSTNSTILRIASSDSSLQGVANVAKILNLNYSYNTWSGNNKFNYKYSDQKFFNALSWKFLLDNYDGENFNLTLQKVAGHFAQLPSYAQDLKDAAFYMYDALKFMGENVSSLSYLVNQAKPQNESWQLYSGRLRNLLLQVSKMQSF